MPVSRKKYRELEERNETLSRKNAELCETARKQGVTIDVLMSAMEATVKNQFELYLRLQKVAERRDHWRSRYEMLENLTRHRSRLLQVYTAKSKEVDKMRGENEALITEGAKLADELKEIRKAPEIVGYVLKFRDGRQLYIKGCADLCDKFSGDDRLWLSAIDKHGHHLGAYVAEAVVSVVPRFAPAKSQPPTKKATKPVATKKRVKR